VQKGPLKRSISLAGNNRKIKVLHIITRFICGGADENTLFTVNGLDKSRYEVHLMIGNTYEKKMTERLTPDVNLIHIDDMVRKVSPLRDLRALYHIYRIIKTERYDIMHTHTSKAGFLGRIAARLGGVTHIIHGVHTIPFYDVLQPQYNRFYLSLERFAARFTNLFIAVGEELKSQYIREGVGTAEQYHIVYSGMDLEPFERARQMSDEERKSLRQGFGFGSQDTVVGIVSRLEPGKGFNFFSSIVEKIVKASPEVKFLVVGDGSLRESLEREVKAKNLENNIVFAGQREDVARVIALFDIAIFTSLLEGLPRTVVQYVLLGKPIVTFEVGGIREVIKDGEQGYIVSQNDIDGFVDRVVYLLKHPEVAEQMRQNGRNFPRFQWSINEMVSRIETIYQRLLPAGRTSNN